MLFIYQMPSFQASVEKQRNINNNGNTNKNQISHTKIYVTELKGRNLLGCTTLLFQQILKTSTSIQ